MMALGIAYLSHKLVILPLRFLGSTSGSRRLIDFGSQNTFKISENSFEIKFQVTSMML